jgi:hypothetical protein
VEPGNGKVRFVDTKNGRKTDRLYRTMPILFECVRNAFIDIHQRNDKPGGAVCLNATGRLWKDDSPYSQMIRAILEQEYIAATRPRKPGSSMYQVIQTGFPMHGVASWIGQPRRSGKSSDTRYSRHPRPAPRPVGPPLSADEGMSMPVPVRRRFLVRPADVLPGLEPPALQR